MEDLQMVGVQLEMLSKIGQGFPITLQQPHLAGQGASDAPTLSLMRDLKEL